MNQKLRAVHGIQVPPNLVNAVMSNIDTEGLEARSLYKKARKRNLLQAMLPSLLSLDSHDNMYSYHN